MPEHATGSLPCIALVYGQEAAVAHVRDAIAGKVEVVYAAAAADFDVASMTAAHATAALVNLDDADWLGDIEPRLREAGVAVVYNDPEISSVLEGWGRARWLRHLLAKLCGSGDVDPPRPEPRVPAVATATPEPAAIAALDPAAVASDATLSELPLSTEEIETMSIDLATEQEPAIAASADILAMDMAVEEAAASATRAPPSELADASGEQAHALPVAALETDFDAASGLDVDTEALSAMIDARLAEPGAQMPEGASQVWRVVDGETVAAAPASAAAEPASAQPNESAGSITTAADAPAARVQDDSDVLASLPSLDDWQLMDHDAPVVAASSREQRAQEPALLDSFAGLELVPMETIVPLKLDTDPIERWLDDSAAAKQKVAATAHSGAGGGQA